MLTRAGAGATQPRNRAIPIEVRKLSMTITLTSWGLTGQRTEAGYSRS